MFKRIFSKDINIPTLRLSGVIGQAGIARSGLTITGIEKLIDKLYNIKKQKNMCHRIVYTYMCKDFSWDVCKDSVCWRFAGSLGVKSLV